MKRRALAALLAASAGLAAREARATGVAHPAGAFARLSTERAVVVWDPVTKIEHLVRRPLFEGDAKGIGFLVPTPVVPRVAKEGDAVLARFDPAAAAPPKDGPLQRVQIDDYELVTLKADNAQALAEWLAKCGFAPRASLSAWVDGYLKRQWVVTAMRYAPRIDAKPPVHAAGPVVRLSFKTEQPFYPYTEPEADPNEAWSFAARYPQARYPRRSLDLWVVAPEPVRGTVTGGFLAGPPVASTKPVSGEELARLLGDTSAWGFDPRGRPQWTVSHLHEDGTSRVAFDDLALAPAPAAAAPAVAPSAPTPPPKAEPHHARSRKHRRLHWLAALAVLAGLGAALLSSRKRSPI